MLAAEPRAFLLLETRMRVEPFGSAPDARAYFLLLRQKKVAKEKATPGSAVGCADFPALLDGPGGCGTRLGCAKPQTVLADCPRPASAARRATWGPRKASQRHRSDFDFSPLGTVDRKTPAPSFPRKRESRAAAAASGASLGPRLRGDDGKLRSTR